MANQYRKRSMRNFSSAGNSVVKFTGRAASKATVGVFRYMATDHLGTGDALNRMPKMGAFDSLKYVLMQFLIRMVAIGITAVIFFVAILFLASIS